MFEYNGLFGSRSPTWASGDSAGASAMPIGYPYGAGVAVVTMQVSAKSVPVVFDYKAAAAAAAASGSVRSAPVIVWPTAELQSQPPTFSAAQTTDAPNVGLIVGSTLGSVGFLLCAVLLALLWFCRGRKHTRNMEIKRAGMGMRFAALSMMPALAAATGCAKPFMNACSACSGVLNPSTCTCTCGWSASEEAVYVVAIVTALLIVMLYV